MNWDAWITLGVTGLVFSLLAGTQILCSRAFGHHRIFFLSLGSIDDQRG